MSRLKVADHSLLAGELAQLAGVSTDTLRHYERKGVLARPRRSSSGYRLYPSDALDRVRLVRRALTVGFTLDELARVFKVRDGGGAPCREVRDLAATKLSDLESQLKDMLVVRDELRAMIRDWDLRLADLPAGKRAGLLEVLAGRSTKQKPAGKLKTRNLTPKYRGKGKNEI